MKNNLFFDDVIYGLQKHGGISTFWHEITSRISSSMLFNVTRFAGTKVSRYMPIRVGSGIFHSSYNDYLSVIEQYQL